MLIVDSVAPIVAPALVPGPARNIANGAVAQVARTLLSIAVDHDIAVIVRTFYLSFVAEKRAF